MARTDEVCEGKRERLLAWIRDGDPAPVPVMIGPGFHLAAAYFNLPVSKIDWKSAAQAAVETRTENVAFLGTFGPLEAIDFTDKLALHHRKETLPDGRRRRTTTLVTPEGPLTGVWEVPPDASPARRKLFVNCAEDLPAFWSFLRIALRTILRRPEVRRRAYDRMRKTNDDVGGRFPTALHAFPAVTCLLTDAYCSCDLARQALGDHPDVAEELFDLHRETTRAWMDLAVALDVDIYHVAVDCVRGLADKSCGDLLVEQVKSIIEFARAEGMLTWVSVRDDKSGVLGEDAYSRIGVDLVETRSAHGAGKVGVRCKKRKEIGSDVTTCGGVESSLLESGDVRAVKARAHAVLDGCKGYRHMLGNSPESSPLYSWESLRALADVVQERDAVFL